MPKKTASVRKDPTPRPINGASTYFALVNPSPDKEYRWIYKAAAEMGVDYYEAIGYVPVQYTEGGVRARVGKALKPGAFIESRGHLLMEIEKDRAQEIYENGEDGDSGQAAADIIEKKMFNSKKAIAELTQRIAMRSGEGNEYFSLEAERGSVALAAGDE